MSGTFNPKCEKDAKIQTDLMLEVKQKENFDLVVRIFHKEDSVGNYLMNLYDKQNQIVEIQGQIVKKDKITENGLTWDTYTYKSSQHNTDRFIKVIAKINNTENKSILEVTTTNTSQLSTDKSTENSKFLTIKIPSCNTVVGLKSQSILKEQDLGSTTSLISYPKTKSNSNSIRSCNFSDIQKIIVKPENFLYQSEDQLFVKDQVKSLDDQKNIYYELFYHKDDDDKSYFSGWFHKMKPITP